MNRLRSAAVDWIPPEAQAPDMLSSVVTSVGGVGSESTYPLTCGAGRRKPTGSEVLVMCRGAKTRWRSTWL